MAARMKQKLKLLYLVDVLKKYSDEEHPVNATEICDRLEEYGVSAERKAIYNDIEQLIEYGYDIVKTRTPKSGFFLGVRELETPELCLLTDAVRTAKFISVKKSVELIDKLNSTQSIYQNNRSFDSVFIDDGGKCKNENIFYVIDAISRAIKEKKKIHYKYVTKSLKDGREPVNVTKEKTVSPYAMTWQDDNYYLICNYEKYNNLMNLRIDRIHNVEITDKPVRPFCEASEYKEVFDIADYAKKHFGMYSGKICEITLRCSKDISEQITDKFGDRIFIKNVTETHFDFTVKAALSPTLVTWITNYGKDIEVISPDDLRTMVIDRAKTILEIYEDMAE